MSKIGTITIGQSPRADILPEFEAALGRRCELLHRGALDGLDREAVARLAPAAGDYILVTRLRDGSEVKIAERHIIEKMKAAVVDLEAAGADMIVLFCTGEFPDLSSKRLILKPDQLLENVVRAVLPKGGRLAAVLPSPEQIPILEKRWARVSGELVLDAVSPYTSGEADFRAVAERVAGRKPDLVVLDCMGFGETVRSIFRRTTGRPVILPRALLGRIAGELAGE